MKKGSVNFKKKVAVILHIVAVICVVSSLCYMAYAMDKTGGNVFTLFEKAEEPEEHTSTGEEPSGENIKNTSGVKPTEDVKATSGVKPTETVKTTESIRETVPGTGSGEAGSSISSSDQDFQKIFYTQVKEAIEYTWYCHAFEDGEGNLDLNKVAVRGREKQEGSVAYSVQDLIYYVEKYGTYDTGELDPNDEFSRYYWNNLIRVTWCSFDLLFNMEYTTGSPVAYENRLVGIVTVFEEKLARYEELKEKFREKENGLVFKISYYPSKGSDIYTEENQPLVQDFTKLDTYFTLKMPESEVDTNLKGYDYYDIPDIVDTANTYHIGDQGTYVITAGWADTRAALENAKSVPETSGDAQNGSEAGKEAGAETGEEKETRAETKAEIEKGIETGIGTGTRTGAETGKNQIASGFENLDPSLQEMEFYKSTFRIGGIVFIISLLIAVITLVLLAFSAGEVVYNGERHIRLSGIDSCYVEVMLLAVFGLFLFWNWLPVIHTDGVVLPISQAVGWIGNYFILLIGAFSLIRRSRAGKLVENSLVMAAGKKFENIQRDFYENEKPVTKAAISFVIWIVANIVLAICIWRLAVSYKISSESGYLIGMAVLGAALVGLYAFAFIFSLTKAIQRQKILDSVQAIGEGELDKKIPIESMSGDEKSMADSINHIGDGLMDAVGTATKSERMKAELITNVSHDIKTPLTSIINYVGLLKREDIQNEKAKGYINILEQKSQRLKNLIEDLVEASKASSGNVVLDLERIDFIQLVKQIDGEFRERFDEAGLHIVATIPEVKVFINADGRRVWRILENLYQNALKYAMRDTRVYIAVVPFNDTVSFVMKNVSASPLNFDAQELTERFIRGDVARTTEGSGLGLSIAKSLTELHGGEFQVYLDGDLFKVSASFQCVR